MNNDNDDNHSSNNNNKNSITPALFTGLAKTDKLKKKNSSILLLRRRNYMLNFITDIDCMVINVKTC